MTDLARPPIPFRRGACPGVADAMERPDGWLLRVRLPGGALSPTGARAIAGVADRFGSPELTITSRANLQIRGLADADRPAAAQALIEAGLARPDPELDARRAVVTSPLAGHDPSALADVSGLIDEVLDALTSAVWPAPLAPKFGVVVDDGGRCSVRAVPGDVCLGAVAIDGFTRWQVSLGRSLDAGASDAMLLPAATTTAELAALTAAVAGWSAVSGGRASVLALAAAAPTLTRQPVQLPGRQPPEVGDRIGCFDHHDPARCNLVAGAFLGRLPSSTLSALAELSGQALPPLGLRLAPRGGVALVGVPRTNALDLSRELSRLGLSTDSTAAAHWMSACIGSPGCDSSRADTYAAAEAWTVALRDASSALAPVHFSGCEKLCGAPATGVVLVADEHGDFVSDWPMA